METRQKVEVMDKTKRQLVKLEMNGRRRRIERKRKKKINV